MSRSQPPIVFNTDEPPEFDAAKVPQQSSSPLAWAVWSIVGVLSAMGVGIGAYSMAQGQSKIAAADATAPLVERVTKLESGQEQLWGKISAKLDGISGALADQKTQIEVLTQRVNDGAAARRK